MRKASDTFTEALHTESVYVVIHAHLYSIPQTSPITTFRTYDSRFRVLDLGCRDADLGFWNWGLGFTGLGQRI